MNMTTGIAIGMASNFGLSTRVDLVCYLIMLGISIIALVHWFFK